MAALFKNRPFYVQYYILSKCNLNCRMCNIVEANSDLAVADLPTIEKMAINLRKIGAGVVLLTGGEPFLRKDLPDIIRIFIDQGLNPRLQTAGFHTTREMMEACARAGAKDINISLDSLVPEKQDYLNGSIKNSWKRAIETIVTASDIFDNPDRICAFGTVLSKFNYMEIPAILDFATYMGWWHSLVPVHITSHQEPMNFRGSDEKFKFNLPQDNELLSDLKATLKRMKNNNFSLFDSNEYIDSMFYFIENGRPNWRKDDVCDSPSIYFAVLPNGDFAVCCDHRYEESLSVADDNFPYNYRSDAFRSNVLKTTTACSGCNYGSYPEVSLSVRSPSAFISRAWTVMTSKKKVLPKRSLSEAFGYIEYLREKYAIMPYEGPNFTVKPGNYSQRYGDPEFITRGAQIIPDKYRTKN